MELSGVTETMAWLLTEMSKRHIQFPQVKVGRDLELKGRRCLECHLSTTEGQNDNN